MKNIIHLILIFIVGSMSMYAAQADERNLAVESRSVRYDLVAGPDGCLERVKMRDQMRFRALRIDEKAVAFTHYHDKISIDKASAPGAKVSYVQNFSEGAFYDDVRTCVMTFDVKAGKDAKAVFEKTVTDPAQFCDIWFDCLYPVKEYLLEINVPAQLADKIKFTPRHLPEGGELAKEADDKGNLRYTLALADVAELKSEPMAMPLALCAPRIMVTGVFDDADGVYQYLKGFVGDEDAGDAGVAALANALTEGCDGDDLAKIDTIASWVRQNIRYIGIEHGEYAHRPDEAASVLAKRYGDCKGSANLIKAMLRSVGVDGRLCWIGTYPQVDYAWEEFPGLGAGNHLIAAAVLPDTIVYIDGTASYLPKGHIPYSIQGQRALIENGPSPLLADVPRLPVEATSVVVTAKYEMADGKLTGHVGRRVTGDLCAAYDDKVNNTQTDSRNLLLVKWLSGNRKSLSVSNVDYRRRSPNHPELLIDYDVADNAAVTVSTKADYAAIDLLCDAAPEPVDTTNRRRGIMNELPYRFSASARIEIPGKYAGAVLPSDYQIDNKWYGGYIKYEKTDKEVIINCEITPRQLTAQPEELDLWNNAVKEIRKMSGRRIKFEK